MTNGANGDSVVKDRLMDELSKWESRRVVRDECGKLTGNDPLDHYHDGVIHGLKLAQQLIEEHREQSC